MNTSCNKSIESTSFCTLVTLNTLMFTKLLHTLRIVNNFIKAHNRCLLILDSILNPSLRLFMKYNFSYKKFNENVINLYYL